MNAGSSEVWTGPPETNVEVLRAALAVGLVGGQGFLQAGAFFENLLRTQTYFITDTPWSLLGHPQMDGLPATPHLVPFGGREGASRGLFPAGTEEGHALTCGWWRLAWQGFVLEAAEGPRPLPASWWTP